MPHNCLKNIKNVMKHCKTKMIFEQLLEMCNHSGQVSQVVRGKRRFERRYFGQNQIGPQIRDSDENNPIDANRDCGSCGTHFTSPEAYKFHRRVKMLNKTTKFMAAYKVKNKRHTLICHHLNCCFSTRKKSILKVGNDYLFLF